MDWIYAIILGAGAGVYIIVHIIADYPPPDITRKLWGVFAAGGVGGLAGRVLFSNMAAGSNPMPGRALAGSDPMPMIVGVIATGFLAAGAAAVAAGFHNKPQSR